MSAIPAATPPQDAPVIRVRVGPDGLPLGAATTMRIDRPVAVVWATLSDIERFTSRMPMVARARRQGDVVEVALRFRIGFFSAGFEFTANVTREELRWVELRWISGEPRGIRLRFTLTPTDDGKACFCEGDAEFDIQSLGWLVKYFLKHHPEIQHGIFPGVSMAVVDTLRRVVMAS